MIFASLSLGLFQVTLYQNIIEKSLLILKIMPLLKQVSLVKQNVNLQTF